ncbi:MAG: cation:proton antiporter [Parachlamydiaceae bacterium]|nr:cation:proton antiporter [Parachlamydiaceae bacterium]
MHSNLLIVGILTIGFALASLFAYISQRLKLNVIIGYLLAGFIIGPYSPGFVANIEIAEQLAEIGVILMLFGVGMHFKIEDLIRVRNIAIPGAIGQTFFATIVTMLIVHSVGWTLEAGLIIGLSIGVASTVVLVRILSDNKVLNTTKGHIAVGWLIVEDIFTVIILIFLPTIAAFSAGEDLSFFNIGVEIIAVIAKFFILALLMFTWGQKIIDYILTKVVQVRSNELFTLTILALVFVIATGSSVVFGTSIALGAFIAGMVIGKTTVKHQAAANALPLKDIFAVVFFLSIGMLFNPAAILTNFGLFVGCIFVILIIKPLVAYLITLFLGNTLNTALTVAISLAQIGEFSFILAEEAMSFKLIPEEGFDILVACALVSISLNPIFFKMIGSLESTIKKFNFFKGSNHDFLNQIKEKKKLSSKVLIIGFGQIGKEIAKTVKRSGFIPVIIEQNINTISGMEEHEMILFGDAADSSILKDAYIEEASYLLITTSEITKMMKIIQAARYANPEIQIIAHVESTSDVHLLEELNVECICTENELLKAFTALTKQVLIKLQ